MRGQRSVFVMGLVSTIFFCQYLSFSAENPKLIYLRANQVGYLPGETKVALAFSHSSLAGKSFELVDDATSKRIWGPEKVGKNTGDYGNFSNHHSLDFSSFHREGRYRLRIVGTQFESLPFEIRTAAYEDITEIVLGYIRQQRCGYNPFLDEVCHKKDARTVDAPVPDGTYLDVSGGWHDAGDQLRYLLTSGNTVGRLLFTYRENRGKFQNHFDALGHPFANGVADILDEAKWGLDWMLKMHPTSDQLYHQVADDRDHTGFELPYLDHSDYGWGPGSYRVVYYATGKPQGLGKFQNTSTGIANLTGRYAAVMAMAADIWQQDLLDSAFAMQCLRAGKEVYEMGLKQLGCQEGTPNREPYRYYENTWADDMEWGAAELYRVTQKSSYLIDAKKFARLIGTTSWMGLDTARHYEYYPFMNLGHYALFSQVNPAFQDTLKGYYRDGIEKVAAKAKRNPYRIGVPFIWCSNNLVAAFVTQCLLYEKMTGDLQFHDLALAHRDWLLGRNPWGVTQFVGIPEDGVSPRYPHTAVTEKINKLITGGFNDGPVYGSIFNSLRGLRLTRPDQFAAFQSHRVVFHDDIGDYSTNEPTLDGTAETMYFLSYFLQATEPQSQEVSKEK